MPECNFVHLTRVFQDFDCDVQMVSRTQKKLLTSSREFRTLFLDRTRRTRTGFFSSQSAQLHIRCFLLTCGNCDVVIKAPLDPAVFQRPQSDLDTAKREEEKGISFEFQYYKRTEGGK